MRGAPLRNQSLTLYVPPAAPLSPSLPHGDGDPYTAMSAPARTGRRRGRGRRLGIGGHVAASHVAASRRRRRPTASEEAEGLWRPLRRADGGYLLSLPAIQYGSTQEADYVQMKPQSRPSSLSEGKRSTRYTNQRGCVRGRAEAGVHGTRYSTLSTEKASSKKQIMASHSWTNAPLTKNGTVHHPDSRYPRIS